MGANSRNGADGSKRRGGFGAEQRPVNGPLRRPVAKRGHRTGDKGLSRRQRRRQRKAENRAEAERQRKAAAFAASMASNLPLCAACQNLPGEWICQSEASDGRRGGEFNLCASCAELPKAKLFRILQRRGLLVKATSELRA